MNTREDNELQPSQPQRIRTVWDDNSDQRYFSIVDIVGVLTDQPDARHAAKYWSTLKARMKKEGSPVPAECRQFRTKAPDGKYRLTDIVDAEQLLRIIQSIPSEDAEPFKLWLAQVGSERIDEIICID